MPIIFPKAVIEKIVEKVVERIIYVAADLYAKFRLTYLYISDVVKPSVNVIAQTLTSISISVKRLFGLLTGIMYNIVVNPSKPIAELISFATSIKAVFLPPYYNRLPKLLFNFISNPLRPIVNLILGATQLTISRSVIDVDKPYLSYQTISQPPKPTPTPISVTSPSVGVRKSP